MDSDMRTKKLLLKERLASIRQQTELNNRLNAKARALLETIGSNSNDSNHSQNRNSANNVCVNNNKENIIPLVGNKANRRRQPHSSGYYYWNEFWFFNDNPAFQYEKCEGFENPFYTNDSSSSTEATQNNSSDQRRLIKFDNRDIMDIYESILDFKQPSSSTNTTSSAVVDQSKSSVTQKTPTKFTKTCEYEISSPESNDSGIHSEDRLNRLSNGATAQNSVKTSAESSLYSSVISSKKSSDRLSREASAYSRLDEFGELLQMQQQQQQKQLQQEEIQVYRNQIDVKQLEEDQHVVEYEEINSGDNFLHLEQHELPLGWVRCCDEEGIYYWHKPSGTVTRHPPAIPVKPTATTTSTTRTTNSSSNSNISSSTSSSKGTTPSPSPLSSSECSSSSSSSSAPTTTVLNAVQHPAPTSKSPPAKNFNVNNEYESILETTTLAMATSTDDDDNDEAKTFTFSEYVRPKSKTTTATTTAVTNQTATSASEDRSMIGGGGPDSTSLSTFSNLSSSALSNSFDQPAKAQPSALLPLPLSHFSRPSNPSTDTDLDQDNFQDNEDKKPSMYGNRKDRPSKHINIQTRYGSDFTSVSPLSTSSSNSTSSSSSNCLSALDNTKSSRHNNRSQIKQDDKSHHHQVESVVLTRRDGEASVANSSKPSLPIRFYVRSLGWVTISEADLTPERSSRAVNKCINDLSRGTKDLNDVVARWGDGKDLYMDLDDSNLVLIDPIDDNVLNTQPITSIRVWGVGRDNARDFAYVARDKQTKIHMCHVFRCDSAPAKEIANTLKETCRRVIAAEKSRSSFGGVATTTVVDSAAPTTTTTTATNSQTSLNNRLANMMLKRPSYLPDIAVNTSKVDINLKLRSVSFNSREEVEERLSAMAMATSTTASIIEENNVGGAMLTPMDEPCKRHPCKYLGSLPVNKPYGMDVLNEAVDKIYNRALDEYRKMRREKRMKSRRGRRKKAGLYRHNDSGKNDKQGYDDDDMDDDMDDYDYDEDEDDDEDDECDEMNTVSFDSMFELNSERKLGCDVDVCVSPSTITVRRRASNSHDIVDDDEVLFETRIRFLSFMGISNDVRLCGFIVHCVDNSFRCYAFMCENSCGPLCKTIEAACKLRYQKCIDAHPEAAGVVSNRNGAQNESRLNSRFGNFGIQISKTVFDSITKTRSIFSNLNLANISNNNNNNNSNGKSTKM